MKNCINLICSSCKRSHADTWYYKHNSTGYLLVGEQHAVLLIVKQVVFLYLFLFCFVFLNSLMCSGTKTGTCYAVTEGPFTMHAQHLMSPHVILQHMNSCWMFEQIPLCFEVTWKFHLWCLISKGSFINDKSLKQATVGYAWCCSIRGLATIC